MKAFYKMTVAAMLMLAPAAAHAQVWDNGTPDNLNAWNLFGSYRSADDFTVSSTTSLGALNWWELAINASGPTITSSYTIQLLSDAAGAPGAVLNTFSVINGTGTLTNYGCCSGVADGAGTYHTYFTSADLGGYTIGAGTYWLSIGNYTDNVSSLGYWAQSAESGGNMNLSLDSGATYTNYGIETAFNVEAVTTPEPASLTLLFTGLVGIGAVVRRRRNAAS